MPQGEMNTTEPVAPRNTYEPGLDPHEMMWKPFATVVDYPHFCLAVTTASRTAGDFRQIPRINSQEKELHPMIASITWLEPMWLHIPLHIHLLPEGLRKAGGGPCTRVGLPLHGGWGKCFRCAIEPCN